jgi:hypothetical protein
MQCLVKGKYMRLREDGEEGEESGILRRGGEVWGAVDCEGELDEGGYEGEE